MSFPSIHEENTASTCGHGIKMHLENYSFFNLCVKLWDTNDLEFSSSKCYIYCYNNLLIKPVKARHPRAIPHKIITSLRFRYTTWITKIFVDSVTSILQVWWIHIFSKFVIEVIADEDNFQMFQTMAALKKYKHRIFFEGMWCVSELNLNHISLQIVLIWTRPLKSALKAAASSFGTCYLVMISLVQRYLWNRDSLTFSPRENSSTSFNFTKNLNSTLFYFKN